MKRRFDVLASKDKSHADKLAEMQIDMGDLKKSVKAIQTTVQSEKATQLSEEALGLPFKTMTDVDEALQNAELKKKLFEVIATIDKNKYFINAVHCMLLDPELMKRCYISNQP